MCTEVYNHYGDVDCRHKEYQNTFPCNIARRSHPDSDQLLKEPVFLPTTRPNVPPGLLGCKMRRATRPTAGKCRNCSKKLSLATKDRNTNTTNSTNTAQPSESKSSPQPGQSAAPGTVTPSPDHRALAQVRRSFLQVAEKQQVTP
ncbi:hypothetical protein F4777DRAFT_595253 [Nemania sp. FL0916]|nr:hypothetical protein F4777DRAFT_595253 [Nemania sp. FL0916]